jgi:hypothetical protein
MVRRRCRFILVVDAGCDKHFAFEDLGNADHKVSLDPPYRACVEPECTSFAIDRPRHIDSLSGNRIGHAALIRSYADFAQSLVELGPMGAILAVPAILDNFSWSFPPNLQAL